MKKPIVVTGLDIGSSKVSSVSAEISGGIFRILAQVSQPSKGVSKGIIMNLSESADAVAKALGKMKDKIARRPANIYVNISQETLNGTRSKGMVPLSLRGREVTRADITRCIDVASTIHLPFDREIIHKVVHNFSVDEQTWLKNPLGLYASRLSCEAYIMTANVNNIQNIYKCVNLTGHDVREVIFTGIADSAALLSQEETESGSVLIDMGASLTEVSIFYEGRLNDFDVIPLGAEDVKGDFNQDAVFEGLLSRISNDCASFVSKGGKINSIILTGGMAFNDGIIEFMESKLPYPIKMGVAKDIRGDISSLDSVRLATAIGLARYAYEKYQHKLQEEKNVGRRLSEKVVDIFNNYF